MIIQGSVTYVPLASLSASSGVQNPYSWTPTVAQSGTAGYTAMKVNVTESSTGSGAKLLADLQVGSVTKFSVSSAGAVVAGSGAFTTTLSAATLALGAGSVTTPSVAIGTSNTGWYEGQSNEITAVVAGTRMLGFATANSNASITTTGGIIRFHIGGTTMLVVNSGAPGAKVNTAIQFFTDNSSLTGLSKINGATDGTIILQNNAGSGFTSLAFGNGTTHCAIYPDTTDGFGFAKGNDSDDYVNMYAKSWVAKPANSSVYRVMIHADVSGHGTLALSSTGNLTWSATTQAYDTPDLALERDAVNGAKILNGSTGTGYLRRAYMVRAKTSGSLAQADVDSVMHNTGASARADLTLPAAAVTNNVGAGFIFKVTDTDGIKIIAPASNTIEVGGVTSASAGYIFSANIGDCIELVPIAANVYAAIRVSGTWLVDLGA